MKSTGQLLLLRSDAYGLEDGVMFLRSASVPSITIDLDKGTYQFLADFERRFQVEPSLVRAKDVSIKGDVTFKARATFVGDVTLEPGPSPVTLSRPVTFEDGVYEYRGSGFVKK